MGVPAPTHIDSLQRIHAGLRSEFSHNPAYEKVIVDQLCEYVAIVQRRRPQRVTFNHRRPARTLIPCESDNCWFASSPRRSRFCSPRRLRVRCGVRLGTRRAGKRCGARDPLSRRTAEFHRRGQGRHLYLLIDCPPGFDHFDGRGGTTAAMRDYTALEDRSARASRR